MVVSNVYALSAKICEVLRANKKSPALIHSIFAAIKSFASLKHPEFIALVFHGCKKRRNMYVPPPRKTSRAARFGLLPKQCSHPAKRFFKGIKRFFLDARDIAAELL